MKRWSGFMVMMMGLLVVLGCFAGKGEAASATVAMTVTTTNDLASATNVGYTLSFTPITPVNSTNRIVLGFPFADLSIGDLSQVTISDGTTSIHPTKIVRGGSYYYIEVGVPLSGTVTITFSPSFGIKNPDAGSHPISLTTYLDGQDKAATANLVIGTTSTLLHSLSIEGATLTQSSPTAYTTVVSSVYPTVFLHAVPVDPSATIQVFGVPSASDNVTNVTYAPYDNTHSGAYDVDIVHKSSINVAVTTSDSRTAVYTIGITRQYNISYLYVLDSHNDGSTFSATVNWGQAGFDIPTGSTYQVALMDDNKNVITSLPNPIAYDPSSWKYTYSVPSTPLSDATTRIGVDLKDANGTVLASKSVPLWRDSDLSTSLQFKDLNPYRGNISPELSWTKQIDSTSKISEFSVYYTTKTDSKLHFLGAIFKNTTGIYKFTIPSTSASGAIKFMIGFVNSQGEEANVYPTVYVYDDQTQDTLQSVPTNAAWSAPTQLDLWAYSTTAASPPVSVFWHVPTNADGSVDSTIQAFNLYFTDKNGAKLAPIASMPYYDSAQEMSYNSKGLTIPPGATHIAVYTVGQDGAESTSYASGPIGLMDLNGNRTTDLADLVIGLKASYNLSKGNVRSLLHRLIVPVSATES